MVVRTLLVVLILNATAVAGKTVYLEADGSGDYATVQSAIDDSDNGDVIILRPGTYTGDGNRDLDFKGKALTVGSIDPNDPNIVSVTVIDCHGTSFDRHRGFKFTSNDSHSIVAGLVITKGYAPEETIGMVYSERAGKFVPIIRSVGGAIFCKSAGPFIRSCRIEGNHSDDMGGGIYIDGASPTLTDCVFSENESSEGGGIYNIENSNPTLTGCTFIRNSAKSGGGMNNTNSDPVLSRCTFLENTADQLGGGLYNISGNPMISYCLITGNTAQAGAGVYIKDSNAGQIECCRIIANIAGTWYGSGEGAGIYSIASSPVIRSCIISDNDAGMRGGGIACTSNPQPIINHCTITNNASHEGGTGIGGGIYCGPTTISNTIVWDNFGDEIAAFGQPSIKYSNIRNGWDGKGNIKQDPMLTHDAHLSINSPCIDAGQYDTGATHDIDSEVRPHGLRADIGADEFIDTDNDGLPNWWENGFFDGDTLAVANFDSDMDGLSNFQEYETCTLPNVENITYYVNPANGDDNNDGLIAVHDGNHGPKRTIQAAIDICRQNTNDVIILSKGTYIGDGNRDVVFRGKAITVCSEQPNNEQAVAETIIDCQGSEGEKHRGFKFDSGEGYASVLEGVTIINGYGPYEKFSGYDKSAGAAIMCLGASPTIRSCVMYSNTTRMNFGGVICLYTGANARIFNCIIRDNSTTSVSVYFSRPLITGCTITKNISHKGAILVGSNSSPTISSCRISGNEGYETGGIYCDWGSSPLISNSIITGNLTQWPTNNGVAIHCKQNSEPYIANCTIAGNRKYGGGGGTTQSVGAISIEYGSKPVIRNCIIWYNIDFHEVTSGSIEADMAYSIVMGGYPGIGNLNADPCFADFGHWDPNGTPWSEEDNFWLEGDYHLKSQSGRWNPNSGSWIKDDVTSPCVDAGDPMAPIGKEPFQNGGVVNMGAYGGTAEASKSYFGKPPCKTIVAGDLNGDCAVDFKDLAIMMMHWLEEKEDVEMEWPSD